MGKTPIEWTDWSINPIRATRANGQGGRGHYCEKIAPGCANCYASNLQQRFRMPQYGSEKLRSGVELFLDQSALKTVRSRRKPTRWFWCDMSDFFGEFVPEIFRRECFDTIDQTWWHTHQLLTKRPENIRSMWATNTHDPERGLSRENVHLGTSISGQHTALTNVPALCECRDLASVLFLSVEPLLAPVDLRQWLAVPGSIDWVIIGGESGHQARHCELGWIESLVHQCEAAGVPCFVKQTGSKPVGQGAGKITSSKGNNPDEWPKSLRVRQLPFFAGSE